MNISQSLRRTAGVTRTLVRQSLGQLRPMDRISSFFLVGLRRGMESTEEGLDDIERECSALDGVEGAWYLPELDRLVVRITDEASAGELVSVIASVERAHGFGSARFHTRSRCPDFHSRRLRLYLEVGLDLTGFSSGLFLRKVNDRTFRLFSDLSALALVVEFTPEVRRPLDQWVGQENSDLLLRYVETLSESFSAGWSGSLVDLARRAMLWQAESARETCWRDMAEQVLALRTNAFEPRQQVELRPLPLPSGPIEAYQRTAEQFSLAAFSAGMALTHDLSRSAATQFSSLPRPARLGQGAFRYTLTKELAASGILVLNVEALDLLDRVDRVLVDTCFAAATRLLVTTRYPGGRKRLSLNQLNALVTEQKTDDWSVITPQTSEQVPVRIRRWWDDTGQPLSSLRLVRHNGRIADAALVEWVTDRTIESLQGKARSVDVRMSFVDPRSENAAERVRHYQRRGETVLALGSSELLGPADIGIGVLAEDVPWGSGADVLTSQPLDALWRVLTSMETARRMASQSVDLARIDAFSGLILALEPMDRRVLKRMRLAANIASVASLANGYRLARGVQGLPPAFVDNPTPWHAMDLDTVREELTLTEFPRAFENATTHQVRSLPALWLEEMKSPLVPVLATGIGLSALTGALTDALLISLVVGVNGLVGGTQRQKTERRLADLGMNREERLEVWRGSDLLSLPSASLRPGDEIELRAGDLVPADARICSALALEMDESSLTGESLPVKKSVRPSYSADLADRSSMIFEGTAVVQGECRAIVVTEQNRSEARRGHVVTADGSKGVEARLNRLTNLTAPIAAFAGLALLLSGLSRGRPIPEVVSSGVSLAVAAVPEGLPIMATLSQLAAAGRLSDRGALARNPRAIEALGRMTVLCADKTGTLTEGTLALRYIAHDGDAIPVDALTDTALEVLAVGWLASPESKQGDENLVHVTDQAIAVAVYEYATDLVKQWSSWRRVKELPFKSERGYHAALFQHGGRKRVCVKGAPEVLIERCNRIRTPDGRVIPLDDESRADLVAHSYELAEQGLRVLAVADRPARSLTLNRDKVNRLVFRGFLALADPVRESARAALQDLSRAGVRTKMITGDHPVTARAIARELEIDGLETVLTGREIDTLDDRALKERVAEVNVFARVTPAQKARIVRALQANGEIVGMTGDGANDAPAIRLADVGIALGRKSSPSAQQAADLLAYDGRIETIGAAVLEGRALWSAVRDAVSLLVGGNLAEIGFTLIAGLFEGRSPLNARQLLLVNLLTDTFPALAVALRKPKGVEAEQLMTEGPEASLGGALTREIQWRAGLTGGITTFVWALNRAIQGPERASTVAMLSLIGSQLSQTLVAGQGSRNVVLTSLGSLAMLVPVVEVPGLSRMFGCRRPGLVGWSLVLGSWGVSMLASQQLPLIGHTGERAARALAERLNLWLTGGDEPDLSLLPVRGDHWAS